MYQNLPSVLCTLFNCLQDESDGSLGLIDLYTHYHFEDIENRYCKTGICFAFLSYCFFLVALNSQYQECS